MDVTIIRNILGTGMLDMQQQHTADELMRRLVCAHWPDAAVEFIDGGKPDEDPEVTCDGNFRHDYQRILKLAYTFVLDAVFDGQSASVEQLISASAHAATPERHVNVVKNSLGIYVTVESGGETVLAGGVQYHDYDWILSLYTDNNDSAPQLSKIVGHGKGAGPDPLDQIDLDVVKNAAAGLASVYDAAKFFPVRPQDRS